MKSTKNKIEFLVYPKYVEGVNADTTVKIGASISLNPISEDLIPRMQRSVIVIDCYINSNDKKIYLSRNVPADNVQREVEVFQLDLETFGIFTRLTPLPTTNDVNLALAKGD